jgi:hypothetical protein
MSLITLFSPIIAVDPGVYEAQKVLYYFQLDFIDIILLVPDLESDDKILCSVY